MSERIHRVLAGYWGLSETGRALPADLASAVHQESRHDSVVVSVPQYAGRPRAVIKLSSNPVLFQNECRGLSLAATARDAAARVRVPAVLHRAEGEHAIVIERVDDVSFKSIIRRRYWALPQPHVSAMRGLGRWLFQYHHSAGKASTCTHDVDSPASTIVELLSGCRRGLGSAHFNTGLRVVEAIRDSLSADAGPAVQCHGDFRLGNVLVSNGYLYVIDFADSGLGPPEMDIVHFRHSLWVAIGYLPFSSSAIHALWSAFIAGYREQTVAEFNAAMCDLWELHALASTLGEPLDRPPSALKLWKRYVSLHTLLHLRWWIDDRAAVYGVSG